MNWKDFRLGLEISGFIGSLIANLWLIALIFLIGLVINLTCRIRDKKQKGEKI